MILFGSLSTILLKLMGQKVDIKDGDVVRSTEFKHPLFNNLLMFTGEAVLLIAL